MEKGIFVKDIKRNSHVNGLFAIQKASLGQTRRGDPFWTISLADATGSIDAKIWSPLSASFEDFPPGSMARITGRCDEYRGIMQVLLDSIELLDDSEIAQVERADFMPVSPHDPDQMFARLRQGCEQEFTYAPWREFIDAIFTDAGIAAGFRTMPAATHVHHAYASGLLEHTLSVFELCRLFCDKYPQLDRQTLLAGALLHDIGKIREFSGGMANDYTQEGRMLGHIFLGIELIQPFMAQSSLDAPLQEHLKHLILSHHGLPEYGAAREPSTAEAFALHYADNLDAKLAQCRGLFGDGEKRPQWSARQKTLDRAILLPFATPDGRGNSTETDQDEAQANEAEATELESGTEPESLVGASEYEKDFLESLADYPDEYVNFDMTDPAVDADPEMEASRKAAGAKNTRQDRQCSLL